MMLATLFSTTLLASFVAAIHLNGVPESKQISQCDTLNLEAGGRGNINVAVLPADKPCDDAIKEWLDIDAATVHWTVKGNVGDQIVFLVEENDTEAEVWSDPVTIVAGKDISCLGTVNPPAEDDSKSDLIPGAGDGDKTSPPADGAKNVGQTPDSSAFARVSSASTATLLGAAFIGLAASLF